MAIKTKRGTEIAITEILEPFRCDGKEIQRVLTENVDEKSVTYGLTRDMNLEDLVETVPGEIDSEIRKLKKGKGEQFEFKFD
jgi:hypothetical protein